MDSPRSRLSPSTPLLVSIFLALAISAFGYYQFGGWNRNTQEIKANTETHGANIVALKDVDTDNDGLPDWIELSYGSDIHNKDTDGDGTNDGDEVRMGRDPTKKGPNDYFITPSSDMSSSTASTTSKNAQVDQYISAEVARVRSTTVRDLVDQVDVSQLRPRFAIADLSVISDNSTTSLREYANAFGVLTRKYSSKDMPSEMDIIQSALKSKSQTDLQRLDLPAALYANFTAELIKIKTPSLLAEDHLNIVNSYDVMGRSLSQMTKLFSNAIVGATGWQTYFLRTIMITRGYTGIITKLHDKQITFTKEEPGYSFRWVDKATSMPQK